MGKPNRSKGSSKIGKGEVTPTQIAFIVDRYLFDNGFTETRTLFRSEASSFLSKSPLRQVPNTLMTLDDMLNDYVSLKKQKVTVDQEKNRVQNLLQGMQNVMNTYNASLITPPPPPPPPVTAQTTQQKNYSVSTSGCAQYNTPNGMSVSLLGNKRVEFASFSTPMTSQSKSGKRKAPEAYVGAPPVTRKARISTAQDNSKANEMNKIPEANKAATNLSSQTPAESLTTVKNSATNELMTGHGSGVAKCLFNKAIPTNSTCPRTPQKQASPGSSKLNSPHKEVSPTNCTIVTKERITISPLKQITSYTVERSRMISSSSPVKSNLNMSNKRDHVKGRLNFDAADTEMCLEAPATADLVSSSPSGSETEVDPFDIDFSNLDFLSGDFSLSELLVDLEPVCEGSTNQYLSQTPDAAIETVSGSSPESGNGNLESDQAILEYTSTVTELIQGKDARSQSQGDNA